MKWIVFLFIFGCSLFRPNKVVSHPSGLQVQEVSPSKTTFLTKQNLLQLAQVYDLSAFYYTTKIFVKDKVLTHSHPVLTINTKHAHFPKRILASFLHEEFHWWVLRKPKETEQAIKLIDRYYPKLAAKGKVRHSLMKHVIVCYLEYRALKFVLNESEADKISQQNIREKNYPWVYQEMLAKNELLESILAKSQLFPPGLN